MGLSNSGAKKQGSWPLTGGKETSTSLLTKLVPGQMGLSQQLNSKAACLIVRPAVRAASKSVSSVYLVIQTRTQGQGKHRRADDVAGLVFSCSIWECKQVHCCSNFVMHAHLPLYERVLESSVGVSCSGFAWSVQAQFVDTSTGM